MWNTVRYIGKKIQKISLLKFLQYEKYLQNFMWSCCCRHHLSCCWCLCCFGRSVAGIPSFDLSMLLAVANTLLVLLWVILLYSTERLQQQGLNKITGKEKLDDYVLPASVIRRVSDSLHHWVGESVTSRISDPGSRQLRISVIRWVADSPYRWLWESLSKYLLKNASPLCTVVNSQHHWYREC